MGGTVATGGMTRAGGAAGSGGALTGGTTSTGGRPGSGGTAAIPTGGTAVGGSTAVGGRTTATGGRTTGTGGRTTATGGRTTSATGGSSAVGGSTAMGGTQAGGTTGGSTATGGTTGLTNFSFFVTSIEAMRELSGSQDGFGGDLRFGEATGLAGADKICRTIAERSMAGAGTKGWVAFLSATTGGANGGAVNAIDRVGSGPWYDRLGRVVALTKDDLASTRPTGCNTAICNDLPNENGVPNHQGVDNHDVLTGSNASGKLSSTSAGATCNDWTSSVGSTGKPMCGHSWPANSGQGWIQAHGAGGCKAGVNLAQTGGAGGTDTVGGGGGYGGIYCFALQP